MDFQCCADKKKKKLGENNGRSVAVSRLVAESRTRPCIDVFILLFCLKKKEKKNGEYYARNITMTRGRKERRVSVIIRTREN